MQSAKPCQKAAWKKTWALERVRASVQVHAQPSGRMCPGAGSQVLVHRWLSSGERTLTSHVPRRAGFVPDCPRRPPFCVLGTPGLATRTTLRLAGLLEPGPPWLGLGHAPF